MAIIPEHQTNVNAKPGESLGDLAYSREEGSVKIREDGWIEDKYGNVLKPWDANPWIMKALDRYFGASGEEVPATKIPIKKSPQNGIGDMQRERGVTQ